MSLGFEFASNAALAVTLGASAGGLMSVLFLQRDVLNPSMMLLAGIVAGALGLGATSILSGLAIELGWLDAGSAFVHALFVLNTAAVPFALAAIFGLVYLYGSSRLADAFRRLAKSHARTLRRLKSSRDDLQARVEERSREAFELGKRLDIALRDSPITVALQDKNLEFTWIRNAPDGLSASNFIGKTDAASLPASERSRVMDLKRRVLETGEDARFEVHIPGRAGGKSRYFDIIAEPYRNAQGELDGLLSVSVETTQARQREERMKDALLEISHRTKNQLSVLMALTRGLSAQVSDQDDFIDEFSSRLHAMLISQDVLVDRGWQSARFDELLKAQLVPYTHRSGTIPDASGRAVEINGPTVSIKAPAVQNVGLVLHEIIRCSFGPGAPPLRARGAAGTGQAASGGTPGLTWTVDVVGDVVAEDDGSSPATAGAPGASQAAASQHDRKWLRITCEGLPDALVAPTGCMTFALDTAERLMRLALEGSFSIRKKDDDSDDGTASVEVLIPMKFVELVPGEN